MFKWGVGHGGRDSCFGVKGLMGHIWELTLNSLHTGRSRADKMEKGRTVEIK